MALSTSRAIRRRVAQTFPPLVIAELRSVERALGGRQAIVALLALAPLTQDLRYLLGLLGDPRHQADSLAEICAAANVLPSTLMQHLVGASLLKGKVEAHQKIGAGIAAVAEDLMRRAAPYEDTCNGGCRGTGAITPDPSPTAPNPTPEPCEVCHGTGRLRYSPDLERQKLALDLAQLLPKSGGLSIAVQQNQVTGGGASGGGGLIERLQQMTDAALYGDEEETREPREGEVLDEARAGGGGETGGGDVEVRGGDVETSG